MKTPTNLRPLYSLFIIFMIFEGISVAIGLSTSPTGDSGWYESLIKSGLTPPNWVFGAVWPILYAAMAVSFWMLWKKRHNASIPLLLALFALHMPLNWSWNFVFFEFHMIFEAFVLLIVITFYASALTLLILSKNRPAGLLLIPYLSWLAYANYLSGVIFLMN